VPQGETSNCVIERAILTTASPGRNSFRRSLFKDKSRRNSLAMIGRTPSYYRIRKAWAGGMGVVRFQDLLRRW
jgi:hypothetical protein